MAASLEKEGHYGTAHVYRSTANSFEKYIAGECACSGNRIRCEKREVTMYSLSPGLLKRYEEWLRLRGLSWDTVGTYLHTLRATYNRGVEAGIAPYVPRLFTGVFTGRASERKRALDVKDVRSIFTGDTGGLSPELERARAFLELMLRFRGDAFCRPCASAKVPTIGTDALCCADKRRESDSPLQLTGERRNSWLFMPLFLLLHLICWTSFRKI